MEFSDIKLNLKKFVPVLPVWTGHSQTILGHLIPSGALSVSLERHVLTLPDGDQLLLKYYDNKSQYTVSVYHGLAGDADADYMIRTGRLALKLGWNLVLVNHRAASSEVKSEKTYHSGRGEDADAVLEWCRQKFSGTKQIAVGFSMSGSILLNLLTLRYGQRPPDYAVVVNAPLKLDRSSELLTQGFSRIYDIRFYWMLKKVIQSRERIDMPFWGRTLDIDDLYTSKKNGFKDRHDYYTQCSSWPYLNRIHSPTFILTAEDDPFVDFENYQTAQWPKKWVHSTYLKQGGHMGYIDKVSHPDYGVRWLDHYLAEVFKEILRQTTS